MWMARGVFPVPPSVILPMLITGRGSARAVNLPDSKRWFRARSAASQRMPGTNNNGAIQRGGMYMFVR